jgi:D-3-phosphoglycerate dehydrogenase
MIMKIIAIEDLQVEDEMIEKLVSEIIGPSHEFKYMKEKPVSQDDLARRLTDADIAIGVNFPISRKVIYDSKRLKMISVSFTGYDHVDIKAATERGIVVSNVPHYATHSVAELVFGLIICLLRSIIRADHVTRTGWTRENLLGTEIYGKTLGIIGFGDIGQQVAKIANGFGAKVLAYDVVPRDEVAKKLNVTLTDLDSLLKSSDIVTLHAPLLDSTRGLIGEKELELMKSGAILINLARGPLVAKEPLCKALASGKIRAGIDVYDVEPLPLDDPILKVGNTVLTPHIGFFTREALQVRTRIAFENIGAFIKGKSQNVVNPEVIGRGP